MKITKEEFDKLYSDDIRKKEYDAIIVKINDRFSEIVKTLLPDRDRRAWFDYGNCGYEGGFVGYFDIQDYKENIQVGGEYISLPPPYINGGNKFPTRWLWEDGFKEEFYKEVIAYKTEAKVKKVIEKQKREAKEKKNKEMEKIIRSKLTDEELRYVGLK